MAHVSSFAHIYEKDTIEISEEPTYHESIILNFNGQAELFLIPSKSEELFRKLDEYLHDEKETHAYLYEKALELDVINEALEEENTALREKLQLQRR